MNPPLPRIELFGGFRAVIDGKPAVELPRQQAGAVLAYLALNPQRSHSREELVEHFWPDEDREDGRTRLRKALHVIRGRLHELGISPESALIASRETVHLNPDSVTTDTRAFEEALAGATASGELSDRARFLAHAVSLYHGELLPGFYQDCFIAEQNRLSEAYRSALHELTLAYEQMGDLDYALETGRTAVALNPLNEDAHCDLMRLYAANGQPAVVLRQYHEMERILEAELGEKPSDQSRNLMESLRESGYAKVAARPEGNGKQAPVRALPESAPFPIVTHERRIRVAWLLPIAIAAGILAVGLWTANNRRAPRRVVTPAVIATNGKELWVREFPLRPDDKGCEPSAVITDAKGNIYVTGFVDTTTTGHDVDYLTLKYDKAGTLLWQARYNGPGKDVDRARSIAIDSTGNVYVTGDSESGKGNGRDRSSGLDFATVKYGPDGNESLSWPDVGFRPGVRRYNGPANDEDYARKVVVAHDSSVYVTGDSFSKGIYAVKSPEMDYATVAYSPDGRQVWDRLYDGGGETDFATSPWTAPSTCT